MDQEPRTEGFDVVLLGGGGRHDWDAFDLTDGRAGVMVWTEVFFKTGECEVMGFKRVSSV